MLLLPLQRPSRCNASARRARRRGYGHCRVCRQLHRSDRDSHSAAASAVRKRVRACPADHRRRPCAVRTIRGQMGHGEPDTDLGYLYRKQLQDGDIIAINKIDLLEPPEVERVIEAIRARFPHAEVVTLAAAHGELGALRHAWGSDYVDRGTDLDIDYGRYGVAESKLAWLNRTFDVRPLNGPYDPTVWARAALDSIAEACRREGYIVGHVKVMVTGADGQFVKASLVDETRHVSVDESSGSFSSAAIATLNARVQCEPAEMDNMSDIAVATADLVAHSKSVADCGTSFKPGQPVPVHRLRSA